MTEDNKTLINNEQQPSAPDNGQENPKVRLPDSLEHIQNSVPPRGYHPESDSNDE